MATSSDRQYGNPSRLEKISLLFTMYIHIPLVLIWTLLATLLRPGNRSKTLMRTVLHSSCRLASTRLNWKQLQWIAGTSRQKYEGWTKKNSLPSNIDELDENTRLYWIGTRQADRVILVIHGGGFLMPLQDPAMNFWTYVQEGLKEKSINADLAFLDYTLIPCGTFPTPLKQLVIAIEHLISSGIQPQSIQIVGDFAGANLALQLFSHILHPLEGIPRVNLTSRIRGVYLMSPWVLLTGTEGSMSSNDDSDMMGTRILNEWGRKVLEGVPDSQLTYVEPLRAPESWFRGIDSVVERMFLTAGSMECMRDPIEALAGRICSLHDGANLFVQEDGVQADPYLDFMTGKVKKPGKFTSLILEWLAAGFGET